MTVLDRAIEQFWESGYVGTSLDGLGAAMGMGRPSIQLAFGNKEELFLKALDRYRETTGLAPLRAFEAEDAIDAAIDAYFATVIDVSTADPRHPGCLLFSVAGATDLASVRGFVRDGLDELSTRLRAGLRRAVDDGQLPADYPVDLGAQCAVDAMLALVFRARLGVGREQLLEDGAAATAAVLGLAAPQRSAVTTR